MSEEKPLVQESADGAFVHAHLHKHADGTVHSHYHSHASGDVPHEHSEDEGVIEFDATPEAHAHDVMPAHEHSQTCAVEVPLHAEGLTYVYPRASQPVFDKLAIDAHAGSMLAILGNNGAGKSTLLDLLAGITTPTSGGVMVGDVPLASLSRREIAQRIAYVAQQQTVPHLSVYDEVLLGRKPHISWSITERDRQVVAHAISSLELQEYANRFCDELSGGERQKVYIARALAQEPQILILDEPTSALDPKNQLEVLNAIRDVTKREKLATITVLHDINLALRFCDRFVLMRDGQVVATGDISVVTDEALSETYDTAFKLVETEGTLMAIPV